MAFEKRVCVLKQIKKGFTADGSALSGAIYAERQGEDLTVVPRLLGIAPVKEGRYALALGIEREILVCELSGAAPVHMRAPSLRGGFSALVVYIKGEAEPIAFGYCGASSPDYAPLLAAFSKSEKKKKKEQEHPMPATPAIPLPPTELPAPFSPTNVPLAPTVPLPEDTPPFRESAAAKYDDELIAERNYYGAVHDDETAASEGEKTGGQETHEDDRTPFGVARDTFTYYESVREKLEEAFQKYPEDRRLLAAFPQSKWVNAGNTLLGIVYKNGLPEFLCVAAEGEEEPEAMKGHSMFVPATPFSDTVGFFVVFQSAHTGEYVTLSQS